MLSLQQISDRLEIQQLMVDYANALDRRDYDRLDRIFTPDAYIDYRKLGGVDGRYPQIKEWLKGALGYFPTIRAAAEGGYGADEATIVEVGAGEQLVSRALIDLYRLLGDLPEVPVW